VGYDAIDQKVLSYPGPGDINKIPLAIGQGYYLGQNAGIRSYSAVTTISYEEYINMSSREFSTFSFIILSDEPYEEYYTCESVYSSNAAQQLNFTDPSIELYNLHKLYEQNEISQEEIKSRVIEIQQMYESGLIAVFEKMVETGELQTFCTQVTDYSSPLGTGFFERYWRKISYGSSQIALFGVIVGLIIILVGLSYIIWKIFQRKKARIK